MTTLILKKTSFTLASPITVVMCDGKVQKTEFATFAQPTVEANLKLARSSALSFLKSNQDVEDTEEYSDALIGLWRATKKWTPKLADEFQCTWSSYAIRCMRNAILSGYRRRKIKYKETLVDFDELQFVDPHAATGLVNELFEETEDDTFNDRRAKGILREHYIEQKTLKEIAKDYGISSPAVHQLIQRAKALLRSQFGVALQS